MDLTWYGLSCFRITERGQATIVTDPYGEQIGLSLPKLKGDIVTSSHEADGHNNVSAIQGSPNSLSGPGEYEIGGVFIVGIASPRKSRDERRNTMFLFDFNGLTVAHLGDIDVLPTQSQIDAFGEVNVLLLPVGGGNTLTASQASELVSMIEPSIVVPMHYAQEDITIELDSVDRFLKEMGATNVTEESSLRVTASSLPEETQIILLSCKR